ncbi:MAG: acetate--CoA ligase family protein, partial [Nannocystaceae bacterium]|nr:acetate--CoA ligase family protein [Nannocystaceae bacterium]
MESSARVTSDAALLALLSKPTRASRSSVLITASAADSERWPNAHGTVVPDRDLPKLLKTMASGPTGKGPQIVVTHRLSPTILRALRTRPPPLLVVTGPADDEDVQSLATLGSTRVLGPLATLRVGDGDVVACATSDDELTGLCRSLGADAIRVALSPTPGWLETWLSDPALAGLAVAGTIHAAALTVAWARWATARTAPVVLVPVGVPTPPLTEPGHPALALAVAAHALERHTGPVFPSPRVIAAVLEGLRPGALSRDTATEPAQTSASQTAIWDQARRALPMTGAALGMDAPRIDVGPAPTAAFLAQRALLRADRARSLSRRTQSTPPPPDPEGIERAEQLLANAGQALTDHESKVVLRGFSIEVTRQAVANSASGAAGFADRIGYPVVLKALSPDLRRRADIGAIELALTTGASVRRAFASIVDNVSQRAPTARLDGVLVAEMVPPGLDVHCGVIRLPDEQGLAIYGRTVQAQAPIEPAMALLPLSGPDAMLLAHAILTRLPIPGLRRADDPDVEDLARL